MTIEEAYELLLQNINPAPGIDEAKSIIAKDLRERGNKELAIVAWAEHSLKLEGKNAFEKGYIAAVATFITIQDKVERGEYDKCEVKNDG